MSVAPLPTTAPERRELARQAVRERVAELAVAVFDQRGFDDVTVEEVAAEVGVSPRTFYRYFPTKEDAVLVDAALTGDLVRAHLQQHHAGADPWAALRAALQPLVDIATSDNGRSLRAIRVLLSAAALRARNSEKHAQWAVDLIPILEARSGLSRPQASALVHSALACFTAALEPWAASNGDEDLSRILDVMFASVGYQR